MANAKAGRRAGDHVTVVVPCYNRQDVAPAAIRSVLEQDWPLDVVAVDDHSTDDTLSVLRAIDDPRWTVLTNTHAKGVSGARNTGIDAARGTWVAFQDSDDLWRPGRLSQQMPRLLASSLRTGFCRMEIVDDAGRGHGTVPDPVEYHPSTNTLPALLKKQLYLDPVSHCPPR